MVDQAEFDLPGDTTLVPEVARRMAHARTALVRMYRLDPTVQEAAAQVRSAQSSAEHLASQSPIPGTDPAKTLGGSTSADEEILRDQARARNQVRLEQHRQAVRSAREHARTAQLTLENANNDLFNRLYDTASDAVERINAEVVEPLNELLMARGRTRLDPLPVNDTVDGLLRFATRQPRLTPGAPPG